MRRLAAATLVLLGTTAAAASADGPALPGFSTALVAPGGRITYTTSISHGARRTRVAMWGELRLLHDLRLTSAYGVPRPTADSPAAALSHDGATLVLTRLTGRGSGFVVLDARALRLRRTISLGGAFSYDAISPTGRTLYLIEQLTSSAHYYVRAYDLAAGRLLKQIVFDVREKGEPMTGYALSRATGPSGRWAYTLYRRSNGTAFVHALDTIDRHAFCIDVPGKFSPVRAARMSLDVRGSRLLVTAEWATRPVAAIDRNTLRVTKK